MKVGWNIQPELPFPEKLFVSVPKRTRDERSLLRELYRLRRKHPDSMFEPIVSDAISRIREILSYSETKLDERILFAVEKQMAWTVADICDDTKLKREFVEKKIKELENKKLIRICNRYVPFAQPEQWIIKSNRIQVGEVGELV